MGVLLDFLFIGIIVIFAGSSHRIGWFSSPSLSYLLFGSTSFPISFLLFCCLGIRCLVVGRLWVPFRRSILIGLIEFYCCVSFCLMIAVACLIDRLFAFALLLLVSDSRLILVRFGLWLFVLSWCGRLIDSLLPDDRLCRSWFCFLRFDCLSGFLWLSLDCWLLFLLSLWLLLRLRITCCYLISF